MDVIAMIFLGLLWSGATLAATGFCMGLGFWAAGKILR